MISVILSLILTVGVFVYFKLRKQNQIPGPLALPIIGASYTMNTDGASPFIRFSEMADKYGDVYGLTLGSSKCVVVSSVQQIRSVLMKNGKFFGGRPDFIRYSKLFGDDRQNSLALCDWCNLQTRRRNIARRFCDPKPYSDVNKVISNVGTLEMREFVQTIKIKSLEAAAKGEDLNVKPIIMHTCLNMFAQFMCSTRFDPNDKEFLQISAVFDQIFYEINQGYAVDFFPWMLPFYSSHMKRLADWAQIVRDFILVRIINARETNLDDDETEKDFTDALLKVLRKENTAFTRDAILFTLEDFLGGSSALGNTIMITLGLICQNPEVATKIREEVDQLTQGERPVTVMDAEFLPYTMATIKETLRYQSSPIVPHVAMEDAQIDGYSVEKGTVIIINNYKINMDEKYWVEPKKFNPERFINRTYVDMKNVRRGSDHDSGVESENEENTRRTTPEITEQETKTTKKEIVTLKENLTHFMPFSIGKRTCLGQGILRKYTMVALATIVQNFDITTKHPELIKFATASIALPVETFGLTFTPRKC